MQQKECFKELDHLPQRQGYLCHYSQISMDCYVKNKIILFNDYKWQNSDTRVESTRQHILEQVEREFPESPRKTPVDLGGSESWQRCLPAHHAGWPRGGDVVEVFRYWHGGLGFLTLTVSLNSEVLSYRFTLNLYLACAGCALVQGRLSFQEIS